MTAAALVADVRARGVELIPTPEGNLRVRPLSRIPPALLDALRERKAEVLALLTVGSSASAEPAGRRHYAGPWPDFLPGLGSRRVDFFDECTDCERWSWVRYGRIVLCLACATARARGIVCS